MTAIGDISYCADCGNAIAWRTDPTGQRGRAWTELVPFPNPLDDRGFQCGLSDDRLHYARGQS